MTIKQYIKSLEKTIAKKNSTEIERSWAEERLVDIKDALETLGEKEVKKLSKHVISGKMDLVSIDFFTLCYGSAKDDHAAYEVWDDDRMNAHAVKIYESWKQHHA